MAYACPDCAAELAVAAGGGPRTLVCRGCSGHLYGLSPFERMLAEGVGARVWTGSASGSPAGPCPYCSAPMRHADGDPEAPSGLAVCRLCQEVWVPAGVTEWMSAHASAGGSVVASAPASPTECANCGAPFQPDEDGRCHWCHAQISTPQPVVLVMQPAPEPAEFRLI